MPGDSLFVYGEPTHSENSLTIILFDRMTRLHRDTSKTTYLFQHIAWPLKHVKYLYVLDHVVNAIYTV